MKKTVMLVVFLSILFTGCANGTKTNLVRNCSQSVEEMAAIRRRVFEETNTNIDFRREVKQGGPRKSHWFDVNEYLLALPHLKMEDGYVLDYVQFAGDNGSPILFAIKEGDPFFSSFDEMQAERLEMLDKIAKNTTTSDENEKAYRDYVYRYMDHIEIEDSPQGFVEFVIFRMTGNQFYLMWHANYHDESPICTYEDLQTTMADELRWYPHEEKELKTVLEQAKGIDLTPSVTFQEDVVIVKLMIFTKFGGLIQTETTIKQEFPHKVIEETFETLIKYYAFRY